MITVLRKELKFVLYQHEFARIRPLLAGVMSRDVHGGDFGYWVRPLYFDSVYDKDYYDTVDGHLKKSKIRLRIYSMDGPVKLELKQKEGSESRKRSLPLTREEAEQMEACGFDFLALRKERAARSIYLQLLQGAYQPKTLVEYDREAYTFPAGDVRVTFDSNVRATAAPWSLFAENPPWTPVIPAATGVLEVKYSSFLPAFLKDILSQEGRHISANSKYVQARQFYQIGGDLK